MPLCAQIDGTLPQGNSCQTTDTCLRLRSAQLLAEQRKLRRSGEWERRVGSGNGTVGMRVSVFRLRVELLPMANGQWRMHVMAWCISLTESGCIQQFAG